MMMTDTIKPEVGKTYLTRDGRTARCICVDRRSDQFPVICLVDAKDSEAIETYTAGGCFHSDTSRTRHDLVSEAPRVVTVNVWAEITPDGGVVDAPCQNEGIEVLEIGGKLRYVDASIAPLVKVLNDAGFLTVASCSGHGERPGNIALADGREMIIAQGYREARTIDRMFPGINGEQSLHDRAYRYADELRAYLEAGGKLTGPAVESLIEFIMNMTGHGADDTPPAQDTQRAERATQDKAD
jgi:hypothetical protein